MFVQGHSLHAASSDDEDSADSMNGHSGMAGGSHSSTGVQMTPGHSTSNGHSPGGSPSSSNTSMKMDVPVHSPMGGHNTSIGLGNPMTHTPVNTMPMGHHTNRSNMSAGNVHQVPKKMAMDMGNGSNVDSSDSMSGGHHSMATTKLTDTQRELLQNMAKNTRGKKSRGFDDVIMIYLYIYTW